MKDIKGYEGLYSACEEGKIWAHPKTDYDKSGRWKEGRYLKPTIMKNGYHVVTLYNNIEAPKKFLVHRLIAQTFIKNPKKLTTVNHKDFNKGNNSLTNLEWASFEENKAHASKFGVNNKGIKHGHAKLNDEKVREIRKLHEIDKISYMKLAHRFEVSGGTIQDLCERYTWRHVI